MNNFFQIILLICYVSGLKNSQKSIHSHIGYPIPMWSISGPDFSVSGRTRRRIMQRSTFAVFVALRLLMNPQRRADRSFLRLFRRLFTGPGSDTVEHLVCCPIIDQRIFRQTFRFYTEQMTYTYMQVSHPILPIVGSIELNSRSDILLHVRYLSANRARVVNEIFFPQEILQPNLSWHPYLPFLAASSGRISTTLELNWIEGSLSTSVTVYEIHLDGRLPTRCAILAGHQCPVTAVAFCPTNHLKIATGDNGGSIRIWDIPTSECLYYIDSGCNPGAHISSCLVSSIIWLDPTRLVAGKKDREMHFIRISGENNFDRRDIIANPTREFNFPLLSELSCMAPHLSGRFFASVFNYSTLVIWDASCRIISILTLPSEAYSLRFNPLGNLLFVGSSANIIIVGVSPNGDQMQILARNEIHSSSISNVAVHTDGDYTYILTVSINGSLALKNC